MEITRKEFKFPSASGLCEIQAYAFIPEEVKATVQIAHGMAEHALRYVWFAEQLCNAGYAVYINDHLGHGKSVKDDSMLGFFGGKNGYMNIINDCRYLNKLIKKEYPDVPHFFFGHSMGSFLARCYTKYYGDSVDAIVYCGTSGANPGAAAGIAMSNVIGKAKGEMHRSEFINNIAFGTYNKRTPGRTPFDWLTKDDAVVDAYIEDKYCGFCFTVAGFRDLFSVLSEVSKKDWYTSVSKDLPILLMAGEDDPVGAYGKGVKQVYDGLKNTGHNVEIKLYPGDRHEIHNELDKEQVMADLIVFFDSNI